MESERHWVRLMGDSRLVNSRHESRGFYRGFFFFFFQGKSISVLLEYNTYGDLETVICMTPGLVTCLNQLAVACLVIISLLVPLLAVVPWSFYRMCRSLKTIHIYVGLVYVCPGGHLTTGSGVKLLNCNERG